jgi:predicted N-acetyltransferase YhbS
MREFDFQDKKFQLRIANTADVPALRRLVNAAYKELSDMGLNYTATYQDEKTTLERINKGRAFVISNDQQIIGTILFSVENHKTGRKTAYVGQFAVDPKFKKMGLGSYLMDHCEKVAEDEGFEGIQLDTAIPGTHLVRWYQKRGYDIVDTVHWEGKTYDSYILEKLFQKGFGL